MSDASDVTPQQAGIYSDNGAEETLDRRASDLRVTHISIPRQYDEPAIPPAEILNMQEGLLRMIGLVPEHHANDMAWQFMLGQPAGHRANLAWPIMALATTDEIWNKITSILGKTVFFYTPNDRCMDVLIVLHAPVKGSLRGAPIRENYHVLQLISYDGYREPNWVSGYQVDLNEQLPYFRPELSTYPGEWDDGEIPNIQQVLSKRDKEARVTQQTVQRRVLESFRVRFPDMGFTRALDNLLNMIDRIPSARNEMDREKFFRGLCGQKAVLIGLMDAELGKNTLHVTVDHNDPDPVQTVELIKSAVGQFRKQLPETILVHLDKLVPRGYDRNLAMPDELKPLVPDFAAVPPKSLLLGGNLSATDRAHLLGLEQELMAGVKGDGVIHESSLNSFYQFLHLAISGRVDVLDLEVFADPTPGEYPVIRVRPR